MEARAVPGTAPERRTPDDLIAAATSQVWQDRRIDLLLDLYAPDALVRAPTGVLRGNGQVVAATLNTLAEFPDQEMLVEDVLWTTTRAQDGAGARGFIAAHRTLARATHEADGPFGPASGKPVLYHVLGELWCTNDTIRDEWVIRDHAALLLQIGQEPRDWVRARLAQDPDGAAAAPPLTPDSDPEGPYSGLGAREDTAEDLAEQLKGVMAGRVSGIRQGWDGACELRLPRGEQGHGWRDAETFWTGLRSAFPSAAFRIDHRIGREDRNRPPRAAIRWSLYGRHDGWGRFGAPTGAYVYVMGITQAEFGPNGVHREWTLIDDTAIWTQIELARG